MEENLLDVGFISIDHLPGYNFFLQTKKMLYLMSTILAGSALRVIRALKNMIIYAKMRRKYGVFEKFPDMRELIKHFQEFNEEKYFNTASKSFGLREAVAQAFVDGSRLESSFFLLKKHLRLLRQSSAFHNFCQSFLFRFHDCFSLEMEGLEPPNKQIETHIAFYSRMLRYKALLRKYHIEDKNFDEFLGKFNLGIFVEMASRIFSEVDLVRAELIKNFSLEMFEVENRVSSKEVRPRIESDPLQNNSKSTKKYFTMSNSKKLKSSTKSGRKVKILKAVEHKRKEGLIRADILASAEKLGDIGLEGNRFQSEVGSNRIDDEFFLRPEDLVDDSNNAREQIEKQILEKKLLCVYYRILKVTEETLNCSDCNLRVDFGFLAKIINFLNRQLRRFCLQDSRVGVEMLSAVLYNVLSFNRIFFKFLKKNSKNDRIERNFFLKYTPDLMKGLSKLGVVVFQEIKIHLEQDIYQVFDESADFKTLYISNLFGEALQHKLGCCRKLGSYSFELLLNFCLYKSISLYISKAFTSLTLKEDFKYTKVLFDDISKFQSLVKRLYPAPVIELHVDALLNFFSLFESDDYGDLLKALLNLGVYLKQTIGNPNCRHRPALPDPQQKHQHPGRRRGPADQLLQPLPGFPRSEEVHFEGRAREKTLAVFLRQHPSHFASQGVSLRSEKEDLRNQVGLELGLFEQLAGEPERLGAQLGEHPAGHYFGVGVLEGGPGLPDQEQNLHEAQMRRPGLAH